LRANPELDGISMKACERNVTSMMELAGCAPESYNAHQGRYESAIFHQSYLKDTI
jgi:hypothetical protein